MAPIARFSGDSACRVEGTGERGTGVTGFRGGAAAAAERRERQGDRARGWHWCKVLSALHGVEPPAVLTGAPGSAGGAPGQGRSPLLSGWYDAQGSRVSHRRPPHPARQAALPRWRVASSPRARARCRRRHVASSDRSRPARQAALRPPARAGYHRACGARQGGSRHAQTEARVASPPGCAPRGACLRRARLRRPRSGRRRPRAPSGARGLDAGLRSAPQADSRCTQRPRQPVSATVAPAGAARAPRPPGPRRSPWRIERQGSRRSPGGLSAHAAPAVTPLAPVAGRHGRCMHRLKYAGGAKRPPETPRPPAGGGARAAASARSHARHGQPARAAQNPGAQSARVAAQAGRPERAWLAARCGRAARRFSARATPLGGRRAPGRCAVAGGAFAPGPGCGRSPRPPSRAGWLVPGARLARRLPQLRACTAFTARLAGRSVVQSWQHVLASARAPGPIAGGGGRHRKQARKQGGTGPPLDPPTERLRRAAACTPARPNSGLQIPAARRGRSAACGAPMAPRPAACLAGRSVVRFWQCGRCFGPRAPVRRRRQPRSLRSAPLRGRLRREFDPATRPGQRLVVAAARCAPGAISDWCGEGEPIGARDHGQQLRQPRQEGPRCGPAVGTERAIEGLWRPIAAGQHRKQARGARRPPWTPGPDGARGPGGAGSRHESGRRGQPLPAPCVTLR